MVLLSIWLPVWRWYSPMIVADIRLMSYRRIWIFLGARIVNRRFPIVCCDFLWPVLIWSCHRRLLNGCSWGDRDRSRFQWVRSGVRGAVEHWYRWRRRLDCVQEIALWIISWLCRILSVLRSRFGGWLAQIVPQAVFLAKVHFSNPLRDAWSSVPLSPFVLSMRIMEGITHFWHTISAVSDIKRCITLLEVFGQRLCTRRRLRPLGLVGMKLQNVFPLHFNAVTASC